MKWLERISFVNWYLFDSHDIQISRNTLMVGPNGAGKSSILDGIQITLLGASKGFSNLNARAPGESGRKIRDYCYGVIREKDESGQTVGEYQKRTGSIITHIALGFTDDQTDTTITVGVCLSCLPSVSHHRTDGCYIWRGPLLDTAELTTTAGGLAPKSWDELEESLLRRQQRGEGSVILFADEPMKYIREVCNALGRPGRPIRPEMFRHLFQKMMKLSDAKGISGFIRDFILDDEPIDIARLQESVNQYDQMTKAAERTQKRVAKLADIAASYKNAFDARRNEMANRWAAAELELQALDASTGLKRTELGELEVQYISLKEKKLSLVDEEEYSRKEVTRLTNLVSQSKEHQVVARLRNELSEKSKELASIREGLNNTAKSVLNSAENLLPEWLPTDVRTLATTLSTAISDLTTRSISPNQPSMARLDELIARLREAIYVANPDCEQTYINAMGEHGECQKRLDSSKHALAEANRLGRPLRGVTTELITFFSQRGIEAVPVCQLIECFDLSWQPAIESYLAEHCEALYVEQGDFTRALTLYKERKNGSEFDAGILLDFHDLSRPMNPSTDTCAELVGSPNTVAETYIRRLLNEIGRNEDGEASGGVGNWLSKSGLLFYRGGYQQLALAKTLQFGEKSREHNILVLTKEVESASKALVQAEINVNRARKTWERLRDVQADLKSCQSFEAAWQRFDTLDQTCIQIEQQIAGIDLTAIQEWQSQIDSMTTRIQKTREQISEVDRSIGGVPEKINKISELIAGLEQQIDAVQEKRRWVESDEDFDAMKAAMRVSHLEGRETAEQSPWLRAMNEADRMKATFESALRSAETGLHQYRLDNVTDELLQAEFPEILTLPARQQAAWVETILARLQDTELANYRDSADRALKEAERAFRSDLVNQLRERIEQMRSKFSIVNGQLEVTPFSSDEILQFKFPVSDTFKDIVEYIDAFGVFESADIGGLFEKEHPITKKIQQIIQGDGTDDSLPSREELKDYRNFFRYDVEIKNRVTKHSTLLSKRHKLASGGEHVTPLYVTIGVALASMYRNSEPGTGEHSGFALALLDEAFGHLDDGNSLQGAEYLSGIGLQLLLAAPDSDLNKLRSIADTVIYVTRDLLELHLDISYQKAEAKSLLQSDLPKKHPELLATRIAELESGS